MKENLKCVSITKRDYDVANALHIKAYGDALPTVKDNRKPGSESDYCPRCGCDFGSGFGIGVAVTLGLIAVILKLKGWI